VKLLALVLGAVLALSGCGTEVVTDPPRDTHSAPVEPPIVVVDPTAISIPKLGVASTLIPLGLTDEDCPAEPPCLATPPLDAPMQAGWYAGADPAFPGDEYQPGEPGPAVIAGHVDGNGRDGVFKRLHELEPGDRIVIERNDPQNPRPPLTFLVDAVGFFPKDRFPTEDVYNEPGVPELRLITCGGSFDEASGHYRDNVVVWASLA
jgi:hypothetical protein